MEASDRVANLRGKIWKVIEFVNENKIFVHSDVLEVYLKNGEKRQLPLVATLCVLNALVPKGAMLLVGGYGGGKTTLVKVLGRLLTGDSIEAIEEAIIRAHPEITEEKMVGRLHVAKLLRDGKEEIVWRRFVESFWKIIDEINRLPPNAQDIIFSLLSEGVVKYFDEVYRVDNYVLYATINPRDVGTFPLGLPFLDRFGLAVPIVSPKFDEILNLTEVPDTKLFPPNDYNVPALLSKNELMVLWHVISRIPVSNDAQLFISILTKSLSLCVRVPKETGAFLQIGKSICEGCHFNTRESVCNRVLTFVSVRASQDLVRYSKALAWLLGLDEVTLEIVASIAPYVLWHRLTFESEYLEKFHGNVFEATREVVETVLKNFVARLPLYKGFEKILLGDIDISTINALKESSDSDLVVAMDLYPTARVVVNSDYPVMIKELIDAIEEGSETRIKEVLSKARNLPYPLMKRFMHVYEKLIRKNHRTIEITYGRWREIIEPVAYVLSEYVNFPKRYDILISPGLVSITGNGLLVNIHITGTEDWCPVYIDIYGLSNVVEIHEKLRKALIS